MSPGASARAKGGAISPSVSITRRQTRSGARYVVRFRLGGRETQPIHAGSFRTRKEAEARARWVSGELASMRVPNLRTLAEAAGAPTVAAACRHWLKTALDLEQATRDNYRPALERIAPTIGRRRVTEVTVDDVKAWLAELVEDGATRTVLDRCMALLRQSLDAHRDPNPARHRSIRLPKLEVEEINPPPHSHWQLLLDGVTARWRLPMRLMEGAGFRVGELVDMEVRDCDFPGSRIHVPRGKTRAARRWVPVPPALMMDLDEHLGPREDRRPEARVFPGLLDGSLRMAMRRACVAAGIPLYSNHDLRHRFISLQVKRGVDPAVVAAWVGHTRKSLTLDVYTHVILDD